MKILITGGLGYLGGRIANHLGTVYPNEDIRLLVRKGGQKSPAWTDGFNLVSGDILDIASLSKACKDIDCVIHLAALNEIDSSKDPERALMVNGEGTRRLLDAAASAKAGKFIYFSTFHVYGQNAVSKITEKTPTAAFHPYAITHHVAEDFLRMQVKAGKMKGVALRLSNGFGYPSHLGVNRWTLAFNDFCLQSVLDKKIVLKSSGKQHRDFITLTDVCRCVEHLLKTEKAFQSDDILYNLGGNYSIPVIDAAKLVSERCEKVMEYSPKIITESDKPAGGEPVKYGTDKLSKTGFKLKSNITEEIDKTLLFCKKYEKELKCSQM
jgi:UDP-glucose 4-epimerase